MTLPSLPVPVTWSPNTLVRVPQLRNDLEQAVALLAQPPHLVGQGTTGQPFASANDVVILMDSELTDVWNAHNSGSADFWAPVAGYYLLDARVPFQYTSSTPAPIMAGWAATNNGASAVLTHGAIVANGSTSQTVIARAVDLVPQTLFGPVGVGDLIQAYARQDSGGTVNLETSSFDLPTVSIRWVCALTGTQPLPVPPLTACPSPITSAWLNANLRDAIRFLTYPPVAKAHYTAGSSTLANTTLASPAIVPLTTVDVDNYGGMITGTGGGAGYVVPVSGRYLFAGQYNLAASSTTTFRACGLMVDGSVTYWGDVVRFAGTSLAGGAGVTKRLRLNAGDFVQLVGAQASGSAVAYNTTVANQTRLIAVWEGI